MRIQFANKAIQDSWTKGPDVIGKRYRDVLPELENQAVFEHLDRVFETGIPYHSRNNPLYLLINGRPQTFYYNYSFTPLFNDADEVYGIINSGADNTELILAQQRVKESESRYRSMIEQIPVAIALTRGNDHVFEDMNPPMLRTIGREHKGEVIGKKVIEVMPEIKGQAVVKTYQDVLETGEAYTGNEVPVTLRQGDKLKQHYLNISYTPLLEEGKVTGLIHAAVDVTEQVEVRKKIEESQKELKRFKFMADQAHDLFVLMQEDGSFAYLNKKALWAWGYSEEEIQHLRVPDVDPILNQKAFLQLFAKAQKESILQFETQHKTKEGHIFPVEVNAVGLTIGEKPYLFAVARDISHRKQSEEEIKEKNAQLVRINNDLDNFIYTASHDLKAPISNIEALLNALLRTLPPESLSLERPKRITSMMQESVERFKKTIANLTEVVKLQKENNGEAVMVELSEVIKDVRLDLEQLIQSAGAEIEVDVADCPCIHFSEKNLRSVVYNLLSNAIKYRAPERVPRVQITCKSISDYNVLSVKDNGLGMEPSRIDQLFTMFKRFHSHVEGTGIGLYMIKKMVENAGGRIEVESQLGEGTTFHVYFKC
ncbi:PAS domain-containing sensor histidine kinase [Cesiribacter sp. SM1]|uniref:PAS domain-containing sensor histidine kinase n=1 Tax=Cesiribacter sp. SM1 TaxID=2861196 RepID=UPI002103BCB6|nr:PAS domain-containing sensor histidine kinase [Cesiribacter sp. SM1]